MKLFQVFIIFEREFLKTFLLDLKERQRKLLYLKTLDTALHVFHNQKIKLELKWLIDQIMIKIIRSHHLIPLLWSPGIFRCWGSCLGYLCYLVTSTEDCRKLWIKTAPPPVYSVWVKFQQFFSRIKQLHPSRGIYRLQ